MSSSDDSLKNMQEYAAKYITGGMASSFRANQFTGIPMYIKEASGPRFTDISGKEYIDFFLCHGAVLLGHDRPEIKDALIKSLNGGYYAGFDSEATIELAEKICKTIPSAERIRFVNSGTEGTLMALRLARGVTGRDKIIRMDGHFHGIHDYLLSNNLAGKIDKTNSGDRISKIVGRTAGIPSVIDQVVTPVPWNNIELLEKVMKEQGGETAAIIMNIIDYNNGCIVTTKEYLTAVRDLCDRYGTLLIFDEILSGFKTGISCAQGYYGVTPDISCLGKALTNDVPLGVVAGKKKIMDKIMDPVDPVIAGGTFSGNRIGIFAGNAAMDIMGADGFYRDFLGRTEGFFKSLQALFNNYSIPAKVQYLGAGFHVYFGVEEEIQNYHDFDKVDFETAGRFFTECIDKGLYFHTDFTVSAAHDRKTLNDALNRFEDVMKSFKGQAK